jgi:hypothetical protein
MPDFFHEIPSGYTEQEVGSRELLLPFDPEAGAVAQHSDAATASIGPKSKPKATKAWPAHPARAENADRFSKSPFSDQTEQYYFVKSHRGDIFSA